MAWDVTVLAGTLLSAYFVLPANVQFGSLDYLNAPISAIQTAWESNSLVSYLPLAGVLAGGMILETVLPLRLRRQRGTDGAEEHR